eukprot:g17381.t1
MDTLERLADRQTSADIVFETLYNEIIHLVLLPGTRISEVEIARRFDLSRQPVREAFGRLSKMGLIRIRPQRPTVVAHFSLNAIQQARFIRTAIEVEVMRKACSDRDTAFDEPLDICITNQKVAVEMNDVDRFHALDYEFHKLLCSAARAPFAFEMISSNKAQVDRLCMLALTSKEAKENVYGDHVAVLYDDHLAILNAVNSGNKKAGEAALRRHLDRLNGTIEAVYERHQEFFD